MSQEIIAWLDFETTGLDPKEDMILQVAGIITDPQLNELGSSFNYVVKQDPEIAMKRANPYVYDMHKKTGLWDKIAYGHDINIVDKAVAKHISAYTNGDPSIARLGGSSVSGVDVPFRNTYMPRTTAVLSYRVVDVTSIAYAACNLGWVDGYYKKGYSHDAVDDIRESLEELKWINSHWS